MADDSVWPSVAAAEDEPAAGAEDLYGSVCRLQAEEQTTESALRATQKEVEQLREAIAAHNELAEREQQAQRALEVRLEELRPVQRGHELASAATLAVEQTLLSEVRAAGDESTNDHDSTDDTDLADTATVLDVVQALTGKLRTARGVATADELGGRARVTFDESCMETVTPVDGANWNRTRHPTYEPHDNDHPAAPSLARLSCARATHGVKRTRCVVATVAALPQVTDAVVRGTGALDEAATPGNSRTDAADPAAVVLRKEECVHALPAGSAAPTIAATLREGALRRDRARKTVWRLPSTAT